MAKAKAKAKGNGKAKRQAPGLPSGFTAIEGYAPKWDHEAEPVLQGTWGKVRDVEVIRGRGKKAESDTAQVCDVTKEDGHAVAVWNSAGLKQLFETAEEGQEVYIEFLGMGEAKKGQNAPKLFRCAVRD